MTDNTFDFGEEPPTNDRPPPDALGDDLIRKGLAPNSFILDLNRGLTVPAGMELPYPWNLPSRLFQFPIEVTDLKDGAERRIGVLHPLLKDHPFVKHVEAVMSIEIDPAGAPNEYGYSDASKGQWWHAVDLVSCGHWRELLDTARFTAPQHIAGAVSYGLDYSPHDGKKRNGYISTREAREIMKAINSPEFEDRDAIITAQFCLPSPHKQEKGSITWPINTRAGDQEAKAWGRILGIEAGYFAHNRAGFLNWTERGRHRFPAAERGTPQIPIEPPEPKRPAKVDPAEIADRPASANTAQLDLF